MPQELVEQRVLSNLAVRYKDDALLERIKMNHFGYVTSQKPAKTVGCLLMLLDDCLEWLTTNPSSRLLDQRPKVIHKLLVAVIAHIKEAVNTYSQSVTLAARTGAKSLATHYVPEMANFYKVQTGDKGDEKSGFHTMMAYRNASQHYRMLDSVQKGAAPQNLNPARLKLLVDSSGMKPGDLVNDPVFLSRMVDAQANDDLVAYMRKHTRLKFQIFFIDSKLYRRKPDVPNPMDPAHLERLSADQWIYAVSKETEPQFFCVNDQDPKLMQMTSNVQLNHSSFLKGRPALCAGTLIVEDGDLIWLTNNSGHYQPSWKNLYDLAQFLDQKGIITAKTRLLFTDPAKGKIQKGDKTINLSLDDYEFDAREFLRLKFYALPFQFWNAAANKKVAPWGKSTQRADPAEYAALLETSGRAEFLEVNPQRMKYMYTHARQRGVNPGRLGQKPWTPAYPSEH
jgi:hypothetical protein